MTMGLDDTAMPPILRRCSSVRRWIASATAVSGTIGGPASQGERPVIHQ